MGSVGDGIIATVGDGAEVYLRPFICNMFSASYCTGAGGWTERRIRGWTIVLSGWDTQLNWIWGILRFIAT